MTEEKKTGFVELVFYGSCIFSTAFFVYWRGQDRNWDLLNYHFYQGYFLFNGRFLLDIAAAKLQSFLNPTANVLAYILLARLPFPIGTWIILLIQLLSIPPVVLLAREIGGWLGYPRKFTSTILAILLSLQAPLWWSELGTTFFSSWTAPLILWGVYILFSAYQASNPLKRRVALAGFLFGLAAGLKLTNALFVVSGLLMLSVLFYKSERRSLLVANVYFVLSCTVGFGCTAWWNWYLLSIWESPVFPLYNAIFKSEFYDFINFRDERWRFSSFQDVFTFIVQSAWGTNKTSEIAFADGRILVLALLVPAAILSKPAIRLNKQIIAFLVFMACTFILWALVFAYQRYLMPFELLQGLLIWILVVRVVESAWLQKAIMFSLIVGMALAFRVPDWGHAPTTFGEKNPFSIELDEKLSATPARYLVVGAPISYVLPSFHPSSSFYGLDFSRQVDDLIFKKIAENANLPLRIVAKDTDAPLIPERLKRAGYDPFSHSLDCQYFKTGIGRYIVCEIQLEKRRSAELSELVDADFSVDGYLRIKGILWDRGWSFFEKWGRWSDGERVEFGFSNCLPQGELKLVMTGHAFGPNVGLPIEVALGNLRLLTDFTSESVQRTIHFTNQTECIKSLVINIPKPTSPLDLGLSADARRLGIGLVGMKIIRE